MAKQRLSIRLLFTSLACINISNRVHGMRVFPMFNIVTTNISIAPPTISHFRCDLDSNHWVPLMLHYLLQPHRKNIPMFTPIPTKPPYSLSGFNTSANRSMIFFRRPMLITISPIINTGYYTSRQGLVTFGEGASSRVASKFFPTSLWDLHYHQGCGGQWFWAQHSPLPWLAPNV